jgi:serine protease SohB
MQFLTHYASFLLNTATIVVAIIIVLVTIVALASKNKTQSKHKIVIEKLNKRYQHYKQLLGEQILSKKALKTQEKQSKKAEKKADSDRSRIFVLRFKGDIKANQVEHLREEITALLTVASAEDEVVVCLESGGGVVHGYGLAASQLQRIRERNIPLTISIDKVAASGGYMMACVGDKIIAAPFAIIGSIGVVMQMPNFNKWLDKHNIEYEQLTAGEYKRTLTLFGKNTDKDREKMQEELEETQILFKDFIRKNRPQVDLDEVATGEHWFATKALEYKLVDELQTSDDYLLKASEKIDIYEIKQQTKKSFLQKVGKSASLTLDDLWSKYSV